MQDNKYAPPRAAVDESPAAEGARRPPPRSVKVAVTLLCVSLLLGVPELYTSTQSTPSDGTLTAVTIGTALIQTLLVIQIYRGRNWARMAFVVYTLFALLSASRYSNLLSSMSMESLPALLEWALLLAGSCLLFFPLSSATWFKRSVHT